MKFRWEEATRARARESAIKLSIGGSLQVKTRNHVLKSDKNHQEPRTMSAGSRVPRNRWPPLNSRPSAQFIDILVTGYPTKLAWAARILRRFPANSIAVQGSDIVI